MQLIKSPVSSGSSLSHFRVTSRLFSPSETRGRHRAGSPDPAIFKPEFLAPGPVPLPVGNRPEVARSYWILELVVLRSLIVVCIGIIFIFYKNLKMFNWARSENSLRYPIPYETDKIDFYFKQIIFRKVFAKISNGLINNPRCLKMFWKYFWVIEIVEISLKWVFSPSSIRKKWGRRFFEKRIHAEKEK